MPAENGSYHDSSSLPASLTCNMKCKPHAVVVPWPGQGHVNPLLHLSKKLALQGFSITFVNIAYTHARVVSSIRRQEEEENGCQLHELQEVDGATYTSSSLGIKFVCIPDGVSAKDTPTGNVPELCKGVNRSAPAFVQLLKELQPRPTCIISDTFLLHTQDAANELGIPRVSFWTQSAASYAAHLAAARGLIQLPGPTGSEEKLITNIVGTPPLRVKDLPTFIACCDWSDFMFDFCVRPFLRTREAVCVLMNSFDALEGKALKALQEQQWDCKFYTIGPILPMEYFSGTKLSQSFVNKSLGFWAEDFTCMEWLDKQEEGSVLYVSFGSITELTGRELEEFALGLEASGFPILWVLRPKSLEGGGHMALPLGFAQRTKERIFIIEWAPQLQVLAHPSVGAFFTHCGWNSTLESISQGKPMLGFPYFVDQMIDCRCLEDEWCNGLALEQHGQGVLTCSLVENKICTVMTDKKIRTNALQLCEGARRAILSDEPGSSTANFNSFIHALLG